MAAEPQPGDRNQLELGPAFASNVTSSAPGSSKIPSSTGRLRAVLVHNETTDSGFSSQHGVTPGPRCFAHITYCSVGRYEI